MTILIACEKSGTVRDSFIKIGMEAISCDILPSDKPGPHHQGYLEDFIGSGKEWEAIIAFPPCTHLAVSGARYFEQKRRDGRQEQAICFFMMIANRQCPFIAIENPVGVMSTEWRKPDQIIQPWMFGEDASKKTCLWLKGLPPLIPTDILIKNRYSNQTKSGQNNLPPSADRAELRSITYPGIALAMADQWGRFISNKGVV